MNIPSVFIVILLFVAFIHLLLLPYRTINLYTFQWHEAARVSLSILFYKQPRSLLDTCFVVPIKPTCLCVLKKCQKPKRFPQITLNACGSFRLGASFYANHITAGILHYIRLFCLYSHHASSQLDWNNETTVPRPLSLKQTCLLQRKIQLAVDWKCLGRLARQQLPFI